MQTNTVDVTTLSDTELKALAYDNIQQRDAINSSLEIITNEMNARVAAQQAELQAQADELPSVVPPVEGEVVAPKKGKKAAKK